MAAALPTTLNVIRSTGVLLIAFAFLSGCGRSAERSRSASEGHSGPPSSAMNRYVSRANAVCSHYNDLLSAMGQPAGPLSRQRATAHRRNLVSLREVTALQRLPAPPEDRLLIDGISAEAERGILSADATTRLISRNPAKANQLASDAVSLLRDANRRLRALGLRACAR